MFLQCQWAARRILPRHGAAHDCVSLRPGAGAAGIRFRNRSNHLQVPNLDCMFCACLCGVDTNRIRLLAV